MDKIVTHIKCSRYFERQLEKVPDFIRKKVLGWIYLVERIGLTEVMKSPGLHDESLRGRRSGQRSIRLNRSYRLIYRQLDGVVYIELLEIHKHDY